MPIDTAEVPDASTVGNVLKCSVLNDATDDVGVVDHGDIRLKAFVPPVLDLLETG